jgi:hypothetical protein
MSSSDFELLFYVGLIILGLTLYGYGWWKERKEIRGAL